MKAAILFILIVSRSVSLSQDDNLKIVREKTQEKLQKGVSSVSGAMGFVAFDMKNRDRFAINENLLFPQASAIKIPILMEVFKQAHEGKLRLNDMRWVEKKMQVGGSGILVELGDRTSQLSVRDLCVLMIVLSDNTATNMLIELVGMKNINTTLASLGFVQTKVQRVMLDQAASARGDENLSTPAEASRIMEMLFKGEFINRAVCDDILSILKKSKPNVGAIQSGVPSNVPVVFKPGGIAGVHTEWAIVYAQDLPYVLVVMENYGIGNQGNEAMQEISKVLYEYYSRLSHATRYGTYVTPPRK